jgi:Family of unknown function (DUF6521)
MSPPPAPRPFEEEALFNPAFLGLLLRESAAQFEARSGGRALPVLLAYLTIPVALHGPTRQTLPRQVSARMGEWVRAHPALLSDLPVRALSLRPLVSAAACFALRHGLLEAKDGELRAGKLKRRPPGMPKSAEVDDCLSRAGFLGRWFSEQVDPTTTLAIWGLRA